MASKGPKKVPVGRPKKLIDWAEAERLAGINCTAAEMGTWFGLDDETITRKCLEETGMNFADWYKKHSNDGKRSLRRRMFEAAIEEGNTTMMIWLSKQHLDMKDKIENNSDIRFKKTPKIKVIFADDPIEDAEIDAEN
jgi:hypothetical protein